MSSAQVATATTTSACTRSSGGRERQASQSATQVAAPRTSWRPAPTCVSTASSTARKPRMAAARLTSALELERVPRGHRRELEQGAAASRLGVAEVGQLLVPRDLEQA